MNSADWSPVIIFALEREAIRERRERGESAPWTNDTIMQKHHFCNVRRRDDRVSRWLLKNYYLILRARGGTDYWLAAAAARLINWPPTLQRLVDDHAIGTLAERWDKQRFGNAVEGFKQEGNKAFTAAYMLYNGGRTAANTLPKSHFTAQTIDGIVSNSYNIKRAINLGGSFEQTVAEIQKAYGVHSFISGQIAADLTYIQGYGGLSSAHDLHTWAPIGPGSRRGLNRVLGRPSESSWKQDDFNAALMELRALLPEDWGVTLMDVQNIMCEYEKYARIRTGESRKKNRVSNPRMYTPENRYNV